MASGASPRNCSTTPGRRYVRVTGRDQHWVEFEFSLELLGVCAEVRQGPGELGRRLDHALREVLMGASRSEFVIAALVPMPAGPVRIKAENFFSLDLDAEGGASHLAL